jgi:hypothetical protein
MPIARREGVLHANQRGKTRINAFESGAIRVDPRQKHS